ncbi:PrGVORF25 [Pieris rapae granulovirus Wuhan]|uniref:PrGVORF25 n=1 Tax=Pieris rapae granulovirus Wuhan TaxID=2848030 RepID=D2J4J2_9BBAC|nr:PrGVORF25 [Betabaculovirus arrapae]ACZ63511.1 PrGVORF25 [Betabaculovirus arrapae]AGS18788.1 ORF25 [Pieris rapae granulovirus]UOS85699.1 ORF25 [Pieris rapae granulovirus]
MFPAETISLNQIVEILKEAIEAVENEDLKNKLLQIKNKCTATKTVKWKKESAQKYTLSYMHVYYKNIRLENKSVLAFYVNSKSKPKIISTAVESGQQDEYFFNPAFTIFLGDKMLNLHVPLLKEIKKMSYFYKYKNTKNRFRYVHYDDLKKCLENVANLCGRKYDIVENNINSVYNDC